MPQGPPHISPWKGKTWEKKSIKINLYSENKSIFRSSFLYSENDCLYSGNGRKIYDNFFLFYYKFILIGG